MSAVCVALWEPQQAWAFAPLAVLSAAFLIFAIGPSVRTPLDPWIALYLLSFAVSLALRTTRGLYAQEIMRIGAFVSVYYLAVWCRRDPRLLRSACQALVLIGTVVALLGVAESLAHHKWELQGLIDPFRINWRYRTHVQFSGYLAMTAGLAVGGVLAGAGRRSRILYACSTTLLLAGMLLSQSRIGWIAAALTGGIAWLLIPGDLKRKAVAGVVAMILGGAAMIAVGGSMWARTRGLLDRSVSGEMRADVWVAAVDMIKDHALLGVGPGMLRYDIMSYRPHGLDRLPEHAYNQWLNVVAAQGSLVVPALAAITVILAVQIIRALRSASPGEAGLKAGAAIGLLAVGIHDLVDFNMDVWVNGALACALAGWIQPVRVGGLTRVWRPVVGAALVSCIALAGIYGASDWCQWRSGSGPSDPTPKGSLSDRWRYASQATRILPWNAPAKRERAKQLSEIAQSQKTPAAAKRFWTLALKEWGSYLDLNPRDAEARYFLAVALAGVEGRITDDVLKKLDLLLAARAGQKPQLVTCVKYVLSRSGPEDQSAIRWAEGHIANAMGLYRDPESQWRVPAVLYSFWRSALGQPAAVEKIRSFYERYGIGKDRFHQFLKTSNLWPYYAKDDVAEKGGVMAGVVSADAAARMNADSRRIELEPIGTDWERGANNVPVRHYRIPADPTRSGQGQGIGTIVLTGSGDSCGGAPPYLKVAVGGTVMAGFLFVSSDERHYRADLPRHEADRSTGVTVTLENAENGPPNPCSRSARIRTASILTD